jgi:hypothetical protein
MFNGRYANKDLIRKRLHQYYGLTAYDDDLKDFIYDGIRAIGHYSAYVLKVTDGTEGSRDPIEVEEYRGLLPGDIEYPIIARDYETKMPMRCMSSVYKRDKMAELNTLMTYQLNYNHIFSSTMEHKIELAYLGFPTDQDNFPVVPDHEEYLKAITAYVANIRATNMYMKGQLDERRQYKAEQDWYAYANAPAAIEIPSEEEMEEIIEEWKQLLPPRDRALPGYPVIMETQNNEPENLDW